MWVRFHCDHDFIPPEDRRVCVAYKKDMEVSVKRAWGRAMIAAGKCKAIPTPRSPSSEAAQ